MSEILANGQNAQTNAPETMTEILIELFQYFGSMSKKYILDQIAKSNAEIGKTKEELESLVKALDGLDFKEDGQIDVKTLTSKIALTEADVETLKKTLDNIKNDVQGEIEKANVQVKADLKDLLNKEISDVKAALESEIKVASNGGLTEADVEKIVDAKVAPLKDQIKSLQVDMDKVKAELAKNSVF